MPRRTAWLREPLLHFLLGAALIFGYFALLGSDEPADSVTLSAADSARLNAQFAAQFARPPTRAEQQGLVEEEVYHQLMVREALRLGLDRGDRVIDQRLIQKMEFLRDDALTAPSERDLQKWLDAHPARYRGAGRSDFAQIYLGQGSSEAQAQMALARLNAGEANAASLAAPISLPATMTGADNAAVARIFGESFAAQLAQQPTGRWAGPLRSGFGWHLVRVTRRTAGPAPKVGDLRQRLTNDWLAAQKQEARAKQIAALRRQYRVEVAGQP